MEDRTVDTIRLPGWKVRGPLQSGAQAHTFIVSRPHTPADFCVAKVFRDSGPEGYAYAPEEQRWRFLREITLLQLLDHAECPGVVSVLEFGLCTETTNHPWYIMPLYRAGAMRMYDPKQHRFIYREDYTGNVDRVLEIAGALAETLAVMHEHPSPCIHRDLNMSNVLFNEEGGRPILADFGIAYLDGFIDRPSAGDFICSGAWHWRPPELDEEGLPPQPASDIYMLGGLMYEALTGGLVCPPEEVEPDRIAEALAEHTTDGRVHAIAEMLCRMLAVYPEDRPPAQRVHEMCCTLLTPRRADTEKRASAGQWLARTGQREGPSHSAITAGARSSQAFGARLSA